MVPVMEFLPVDGILHSTILLLPFLLCFHNLLICSPAFLSLSLCHPNLGLISDLEHVVSPSHSVLSFCIFKSKSKAVNRRTDYLEQSQGVGTGLLSEVNHQIQRSEEVCSILTARKDQEVLVK